MHNLSLILLKLIRSFSEYERAGFMFYLLPRKLSNQKLPAMGIKDCKSPGPLRINTITNIKIF
jgi:hypothetical protein